MQSLFKKSRDWYGKYEYHISSFSLVFGFIVDIITLKRIDTAFENLWIIGHIVLIGIFIAIIHIKESEIGDERNPDKAHFWYVNILQFFFGGVLSAFLVFYFRSTDVFVAWPFLLLLVVAFIANESLKRHYMRFYFQISLFFLAIYSLNIYLFPILTHRIGAKIFILSGVVSLVFILAFIKVISALAKEKFTESKSSIVYVVGGIFILVNFLYFTNLIPPIPLSLKDAGVYYSVERNSAGNYDVTYEDQGWKKYFQFYKKFKQIDERPVYAFSAVFSPSKLNTTIVHKWRHYDEAQEKWKTVSTIRLGVVGGRDGGYRTFSRRSMLAEGKWRVDVETEKGQNIGRIRFRVLPSDPNIIITNDTR